MHRLVHDTWAESSSDMKGKGAEKVFVETVIVLVYSTALAFHEVTRGQNPLISQSLVDRSHEKEELCIQRFVCGGSVIPGVINRNPEF